MSGGYWRNDRSGEDRFWFRGGCRTCDDHRFGNDRSRRKLDLGLLSDGVLLVGLDRDAKFAGFVRLQFRQVPDE